MSDNVNRLVQIALRLNLTPAQVTIALHSHTPAYIQELERQGLSQNFDNLLNSTVRSDIVVMTRQEQIWSHSFVLTSRSDVFTELITTQGRVLNLAHVPHNVVYEMLRYIYAAEIQDNGDMLIWPRLFIVATMYGLRGLRRWAECVMCARAMEGNEEELIWLLQFSRVQGAFRLQLAVRHYIFDHYSNLPLHQIANPDMLNEVIVLVAERMMIPRIPDPNIARFVEIKGRIEAWILDLDIAQ